MTAIFTVLALLLAAATAALAVRLRTVHRGAGRLRQRVRELQAEVERAEEAKTRFLSAVTHELRTPLTAILGYQELLGDGLYGEMDERCREPIARIGRAGEQLLNLIDGVLELARLDTGRLELALGRVDVDQLLRHAAERASGMAADRGVALDSDIPEHLPAITTDPHRLARTLDLSFTEAIRASTGATLRVSAHNNPDESVTVEIAGTGLALDADSSERVFGDFDTAPDHGGHSHGSGLRLSVALRLARLLGGDLSLLAAADGTTLRLRIAEAPAPAPATSD